MRNCEVKNMSEVRLIDANALKKYVDGCEFCNNCQNKKNRCAFDCILPDYLTSEWERVINEQPTVDTVTVVRCKDCKYCYAEGFVNVRNVCEKHYDFGNVDDNWFCADGERRSE